MLINNRLGGHDMTQKRPQQQSQNKLEALKYEVANEINVPLNKGDNGSLTTREVGKVGGGMVKKVFEEYKKE